MATKRRPAKHAPKSMPLGQSPRDVPTLTLQGEFSTLSINALGIETLGLKTGRSTLEFMPKNGGIALRVLPRTLSASELSTYQYNVSVSSAIRGTRNIHNPSATVSDGRRFATEFAIKHSTRWILAEPDKSFVDRQFELHVRDTASSAKAPLVPGSTVTKPGQTFTTVQPTAQYSATPHRIYIEPGVTAIGLAKRLAEKVGSDRAFGGATFGIDAEGAYFEFNRTATKEYL